LAHNSNNNNNNKTTIIIMPPRADKVGAEKNLVRNLSGENNQ